MEPYLASIAIFGGNFAIRGWAFCQGQLLSIAQNTALFSLLGTTYGGNGQTTFGLPDLRGRAPIGVGQGPGLSSYSLGQMGGTETVTLTMSNLPAHSHSADASGLQVTPSASAAAGTTNVPGPSVVPAVLPTIGSGPGATSIKGYAVKDNTATLAVGTVAGTIGIGVTGGSQPFETRDPYVAVNYIIAMEGVFPSRD